MMNWNETLHLIKNKLTGLAASLPKDVWFSENTRYGMFQWHDAMTSSVYGDSFTLAWCFVVLSVVLPLSVAETIDRNNRFENCLWSNKTNCVQISPWGFDYGHWCLAWMVAWFVLRAWLCMQPRTGEMPFVAKCAWFCHVNGIPTTIAAWLVYLIFSRDGEAHGALTDASYSVNAIFAILDVVLFKMVLLYEHVLWVFFTSIVYVLLMWVRSHHTLAESVVGLFFFAVVYMVVADMTMMRDTFTLKRVLARVHTVIQLET